jgi:hypothetical protein
MAGPKAQNRLSVVAGIAWTLGVLAALAALVWFVGMPMYEGFQLDGIMREMEKEGEKEAEYVSNPLELPGKAGEKFIPFGSKSVPYLLPLLEHREIRVREKAWYTFKEVTGTQEKTDWYYGPELDGSPRREAIAELKEWWEAEKKRREEAPPPAKPEAETE